MKVQEDNTGMSVASDDAFMALPNKIQMMGIESHSKLATPTRPILPQPPKDPDIATSTPIQVNAQEKKTEMILENKPESSTTALDGLHKVKKAENQTEINKQQNATPTQDSATMEQKLSAIKEKSEISFHIHTSSEPKKKKKAGTRKRIRTTPETSKESKRKDEKQSFDKPDSETQAKDKNILHNTQDEKELGEIDED